MGNGIFTGKGGMLSEFVLSLILPGSSSHTAEIETHTTRVKPKLTNTTHLFPLGHFHNSTGDGNVWAASVGAFASALSLYQCRCGAALWSSCNGHL